MIRLAELNRIQQFGDLSGQFAPIERLGDEGRVLFLHVLAGLLSGGAGLFKNFAGLLDHIARSLFRGFGCLLSGAIQRCARLLANPCRLRQYRL
jgi:hypothetical protein